jgi:transcriptional regulator with XRE-family HTH domain
MPIDLVAQPLGKRVAQEIRAEMARQGISQVALAEALGRNQTYVSYRLTCKKSLTLDEIEIIADILRVRVDRLFPFDSASAIPRSRRVAS